MAHLLTGEDEFRDVTHDDDYRSYRISRRAALGGYRFARSQVKRDRIRMRRALRRVNGFLKNMIEAIANSKVRRMQRDLELRGIRFDRDTNTWMVRNSGTTERSR